MTQNVKFNLVYIIYTEKNTYSTTNYRKQTCNTRNRYRTLLLREQGFGFQHKIIIMKELETTFLYSKLQPSKSSIDFKEQDWQYFLLKSELAEVCAKSTLVRRKFYVVSPGPLNYSI